jgi:hypothetical protein
MLGGGGSIKAYLLRSCSLLFTQGLQNTWKQRVMTVSFMLSLQTGHRSIFCFE